MKPAKEILEQYRDDSKYPNLNHVVFPREDCLTAMEEYANQFKSVPVNDESKLKYEGPTVEEYFANLALSRQPEIDALIRERDILKNRCTNWEIIDKQNEKALELFESENALLKKRVEELERKYNKCIDVIKRFDGGIIGFYDL